jgi:hypothetical protein
MKLSRAMKLAQWNRPMSDQKRQVNLRQQQMTQAEKLRQLASLALSRLGALTQQEPGDATQLELNKAETRA